MVLNLAFYISLFVLFLKTIHTLKAPHQLSRDVAVNLRHVPNYISGYSSNCAITILHTNIKISQKLNTFWSEIGDSLFPRDDDVEGRYHTYQLHDETKIYTFLPAIQPRPRRCAVVFVTNWFPSAPQDLLQMCLVYNTFRDINDIISGQRDVANVMLLTIMNPARTPLRADHCKRITQARIFDRTFGQSHYGILAYWQQYHFGVFHSRRKFTFSQISNPLGLWNGAFKPSLKQPEVGTIKIYTLSLWVPHPINQVDLLGEEGCYVVYCDYDIRSTRFSFVIWVTPISVYVWVGILVMITILVIFYSKSESTTVAEALFSLLATLLGHSCIYKGKFLLILVLFSIASKILLTEYEYLVTSELVAPEKSRRLGTMKEILAARYTLYHGSTPRGLAGMGKILAGDFT
ncbi:hypothetical protein Fcan01_16071 [Folsomia candida]|uniref:Uncharacterized protein n=1 Tax=Folsomia candida TaxID=158441 RepID=A0A226DUG3_FOLCA|nr:hypothetical protein Fcan01_16071 [Folsomia candida]